MINESWLNKKIQYNSKDVVTVISEDENLIVVQLDNGVKIHTYKDKYINKIIK